MKLYWNGDVGYLYTDSDGTVTGITIGTVKRDLDAAAGSDIEVELTTLGGNFFEAAPIMDLLNAHKGKKTLFLSGIVASAGTVIALGFDRVIARPTSMFMIHNAQGGVFGDHNDMAKTAELQKRMSKMIAVAYAGRTGKTEPEIQKLMDDETWFMGEEIVANGFADEMETADTTLKASPMMLLSAQKQFMDRKTMWATRVPEQDPAHTRETVLNLIKEGKVEKDAPWATSATDTVLIIEKNPYGKNGQVYRSALRSMASRAVVENNAELAEWANSAVKMIDGKLPLDTSENGKGAIRVDKEKVLMWLKDNPGSHAEILTAINQTPVTQKHTDALKMVETLAVQNIADPVAKIAELQKSLEAVDEQKVTNELDALCGSFKDSAGKDNLLRAHAATYFKGVKSVEMAAKVEEFKKDPIALKLAGERMDSNSEANVLGFREGHKPEDLGAPKFSMGAKVRVV